MISFKTQKEAIPSVVILVSLAIIVLVPALSALYPVMSAATASTMAKAQRNHLFTEILIERKEASQASAAVGAHLWKGDSNHVASQVMGVITNDALANQVKLTAFRPQRAIDLNGVSEQPYTVQLAGQYSGIRAIMRDLDDSKSKIVLRSVQLNSSEETTGTVTATLGISAYITSDPQMAGVAAEGGA
jgi:hypothetical protein